MGIPTSLTFYLITLHGLITVEGILNGTSQHVVNTRMSISRGRTLEEYKLWTSLTFINRTPEYVFLAPHLQDIIVNLGQIQAVMFCKLLCHILLF